MLEFRQGFVTMSEPSKDFEARVVARKIRHGGNPVLAWNVGNAVIRKDPAGNIKPDKEKAKDKIDGVIAAIMAIGRAVMKEESVYSGERVSCLCEVGGRREPCPRGLFPGRGHSAVRLGRFGLVRPSSAAIKPRARCCLHRDTNGSPRFQSTTVGRCALRPWLSTAGKRLPLVVRERCGILGTLRNALTRRESPTNRMVWMAPDQPAGIFITPENALDISVVWACVMAISNALAAVALERLRVQGETRTLLPDDRLTTS
jgi:hypothetical protein